MRRFWLGGGNAKISAAEPEKNARLRLGGRADLEWLKVVGVTSTATAKRGRTPRNAPVGVSYPLPAQIWRSDLPDGRFFRERMRGMRRETRCALRHRF